MAIRGRPRLGTTSPVKISILLEPERLAAVDRAQAYLATALGVPVDRSTALRYLLTRGLLQLGDAVAPVPAFRTAEAAAAHLPAYDRARYRLGGLCKRGHDYQGSGHSLRYLRNNFCKACDVERKRAKSATAVVPLEGTTADLAVCNR